MEGLQDIAPTVAKRWVMSAVQRAHTGGGAGRLTAGMATADDNHIEAAVHRNLQEGGGCSQRQFGGQSML